MFDFYEASDVDAEREEFERADLARWDCPKFGIAFADIGFGPLRKQVSIARSRDFLRRGDAREPRI